jgi:hypothetical protein
MVPPVHLFVWPPMLTVSDPVSVPPLIVKLVGAMVSSLLKLAVPPVIVRFPTLPTVPVKFAMPPFTVVLLPTRS